MGCFIRWVILAGLSCVFGGAFAQPHNTPLNDLGSGMYRGYMGGLYPGGLNSPPAAHAAAAQQFANSLVARDAAGNPNPNGKILLVTIGMSNTNQESSPFERQEDLNVGRNGRVIVINGAVGGQTASGIRNPAAGYWQIVMDRISAMGATPAQVQAVWLKEANANPPNDFPGHAIQLRDDLKAVAQVLHDKFPNLHLCYCSSRIYGGYATTTLNPEPQAYEGGFSFQWLIAGQIAGDADLNYDPTRGVVRAPLLLWGPYLWADGTTPRSDGLIWVPGDFESDGTHPAPSGEQKVANLLSTFFAAEQTVSPWYSARPGIALASVSANADSYVRSDAPSSNFGTQTQLLTQGGSTTATTYMRFDFSGVHRPVLFAKLSLRVQSGSPPSTLVGVVTNNNWNENTITFQNAPAIDGGTVATIPAASREGTICADVTSAVNSSPNGVLTLALSLSSSGQGSLVSREGGQPPRLILTTAVAADISPSTLDVSPGLITGGDLSSLLNSDDVYLTLRPGVVLSSSQAPIVARLSGTAPTPTAFALQFTIESRSQQANITQRVEVFNFVSGQYQQLDQRILPTSTPDTIVSTNISSPNDFIGPANEMRARISYKASGPALSYPWLIYVDQVKWHSTP